MRKKKPARKPKSVRTQKRNKPKKPQPKKAAQRAKKPQPAKPLRLVKPSKAEHPEKEKRPSAHDLVFSPGDFVVYPTHGVGRVLVIEMRVIAEQKLQLYVISFERDRMTLRVPIGKVDSAGLRKLSTRKMMETALVTLKGRARVKRTMWSRRAQEYEAKINSGDPISIAEVVRDLHRNVGQPDQSFSERQIYEAARDRLACELAAVERTDVDAATEKLEGLLAAA
ncbi:MAG: CarD family transcriptional regulator [Rhodospirillales bacterium]|nr:CarD family transcriptional regulator [Rhodospirillales bacterium]